MKSAASRLISEDALLVEFGDLLADGIHHQVLALDSALAQSQLSGLIETQPTLRSLLIKFDPFTLSHETLRSFIQGLDLDAVATRGQAWKVPVCMQEAYAQDIAEVAQALGMKEDLVREGLLSSPLKLYMYGFAPGFAYLGGLDPRLAIPRRKDPRSAMPAGALMIAGGMASITSVSMPTGWYVVGQTPIEMFAFEREGMVPFAVGDELHLYEVSPAQYDELRASGERSGIEKLTACPA